MAIVQLHVPEGYNSAEKQRLKESLTQAVRFVLPRVPEQISVQIQEKPLGELFAAGLAEIPVRARKNPENIVREYLAAMEAREIQKAEQMVSASFSMTFPGTGPMHTLGELIAWAAPRYRFVTKTYEAFESLQGSGEAAVVYCRGTLSGQWPDGTPFSGIRFIDRFEVADDLITKQDVWNDIAETRANE